MVIVDRQVTVAAIYMHIVVLCCHARVQCGAQLQLTNIGIGGLDAG